MGHRGVQTESGAIRTAVTQTVHIDRGGGTTHDVYVEFAKGSQIVSTGGRFKSVPFNDFNLPPKDGAVFDPSTLCWEREINDDTYWWIVSLRWKWAIATRQGYLYMSEEHCGQLFGILQH